MVKLFVKYSYSNGSTLCESSSIVNFDKAEDVNWFSIKKQVADEASRFIILDMELLYDSSCVFDAKEVLDKVLSVNNVVIRKKQKTEGMAANFYSNFVLRAIMQGIPMDDIHRDTEGMKKCAYELAKRFYTEE